MQMSRMLEDRKAIWVMVVYTLLVALLCILGSALFVKCNSKPEVIKERHTHSTDTVVVTKTDIQFVDRIQWLPGRIDTVFVFNGTDSLSFTGYAKDTVYIENIVMKLITRDTIIRDTITIEKTVDKPIKHWGFGVMAGMSAMYGITTRKFDAGPSLSVGVVYKF